MSTEKKEESISHDEETRLFIKLARKYGMPEEKITECIHRYEGEIKKSGNSSYENDLMLFFKSWIIVD